MPKLFKSLLSKIFLLTTFICGVSFAQLQPGQEDFSLNGPWHFKIDPNNIGDDRGWYNPGYSTTDWDIMNVPENWDTHNEYARYAGKGWYRRTVQTPAEWKGKVVRLYFEAVYHDAKVWLNGQLLGENNGGYFPFEFEVSKLLNYGGQNTLVVCADNTFKRGAIWNWGGIRRPAYFRINNLVWLEKQKIVAEPDVIKSLGIIKINTSIRNDADAEKRVTVRSSIFFQNKLIQQLSSSELTIAPRQNGVTNLTAELSNPRLWHFDNPNLYVLKTEILSDNQVQHVKETRFGIRKLEVDGLKLKLNGEEIRPVGYNWVPDDRTTGNTLPEWRIKEDIDLMKAAGANMARLSHLPLHQEALDYLDEKGLMTFSEIPLWGEDALVDKDNPLPKIWLKRLVDEQFNHPSVVGWGVGNEIGFHHQNPGVMEYVNSAIQYVKQELDSSRLVMYVSHSADRQAVDPVQFSDLIMLNKYSDFGKSADKAHQLHPGKPVFYSEFGRNLTAEDLNKGTLNAAEMMESMRGRDYLIGASLWTFNDYRSNYQAHASWNTAPTENRAWGIVNVARQKKRGYYSFRKEFAPVKRLEVTHSRPLEPGVTVSTQIRVIPRGKLDIPAYVLQGYKLVWQVEDSQGNFVEGSFIELPRISPGDQPFSSDFKWKVSSKNPGKLKIVLLSPLNYNVLDTVIYLAKPAPPKITAVLPGENGVRVIFEKNKSAEEYTLLYGDNLEFKRDTTINDFIDLKGQEKGKTLKIAVAGINPLGVGQPSEVKVVQPTSKNLPPLVSAIESSDSALFLSLDYIPYDYMYTVEYGENLKDASTVKTLNATTRGVLRIPNLINGTKYEFRVKRTSQVYVTSDWSTIYTAIPGEQENYPTIKGVIRKGDDVILLLNPIKKATGYFVSFKEDGKEKQIDLNGAQIEYFFIKGLKKNKPNDLKIGHSLKSKLR